MEREFKFYKIIKNRSNENKLAFDLLYENKLNGNCIGLLRVELESYMKCIYLSRVNQAIADDLLNQFF